MVSELDQTLTGCNFFLKEKLDLSRNSLEYLPPSLCNLIDNGTTIAIYGNQFCPEGEEYDSCFDGIVLDQSCDD